MLRLALRPFSGLLADIRHARKRFASDRSGSTAIEYALIGSLVGLVIVGGAQALGLELGNLFDRLGAALSQ